ncbi:MULTISPECIES: hypothetical protein [Paenibacillus]|uniref:hypothetical protein n=1 Tax=Paenibacillus TaxID=44249 RepID=UPI001B0BB8ED|nr:MULTISPECIES: hypothetical protein [Paenibacillus]UYO06442.1 hypothetical protein K2F33_11470 [Paenibacillus sp. PSB04]GIO64066.1 hypothetical protein J43TS9_56400 [Paenibacillus cineris]
MDLVVLKINESRKYSIFQFMRMTEEERDNLRGQIKCGKCGADALYRKEGRNGRQACFSAKHIGNCDNGSSKKNDSKEGDKETNKIELDTSTFNVRWNYKSTKGKGENLSEDGEEREVTKNKKKYTKKPAISVQASISLSQILNYAEANIIDEQEILININNEEIELSKLVFEFNKLDDSHINKSSFYWGEMKSLNNNFINIKNSKKVSILIDETVLDKFNNRHRNKFFDVVKSNSVIVFGKVIKTKNANYFVILNDTNQIYFKKK